MKELNANDVEQVSGGVGEGMKTTEMYCKNCQENVTVTYHTGALPECPYCHEKNWSQSATDHKFILS